MRRFTHNFSSRPWVMPLIFGLAFASIPSLMYSTCAYVLDEQDVFGRVLFAVLYPLYVVMLLPAGMFGVKGWAIHVVASALWGCVGAWMGTHALRRTGP